MSVLLEFVRRNPWIFVVLAFVALIAAWIITFLLASQIPHKEVPLSPPPSQNRSLTPSDPEPLPP